MPENVVENAYTYDIKNVYHRILRYSTKATSIKTNPRVKQQ